MALSEIVQVSIQEGTARVSRKGFGVPLILYYHTIWATNEERTYTSYAGVVEDFTDANHPVAQAAAVLFSQNPRPPKILVGRLPAPATGQTATLDFTDLVAGDSPVRIVITSPSGLETTVSVPWNTNLATTISDVEVAIEAVTGIDSAVSGNTILVTGADVGLQYSFSIESAHVYYRETTADWGYDDELDLILTRTQDFYFVLIDSQSPKNIDKAARWCAANGRMLAVGPQYTKPAQFVSGEFTSGSDYTALQANDSAIGIFTRQERYAFLEAAWIGRMATYNPGSAAWFYKSLEVVGADDFTSSERTAIEAYHGNHYTTEAGNDITRPGKTFGGEWIDVQIGIDWLSSEMAADVFALLASQPKVPYTDRGGSMIRSVVAGTLKRAELRGVIDAGWVVTVPLVEDQDEQDRADRIFRNVEFTARLAGAVYTVIINGTVTV